MDETCFDTRAVCSCLVFLPGVYGAVHNQISYSIAPEYFTQFKFHQFRIDKDIPDRIGAAFVGWHASWWMGIVIGIVLIPIGLLIRGTANYFWSMIRVFGIVAITTLVVGLTALTAAFIILDAEAVGEITRYGNEIANDVAFARAGTMHNFSYIGRYRSRHWCHIDIQAAPMTGHLGSVRRRIIGSKNRLY